MDAGYDDLNAALLMDGAGRAIMQAVFAHLYLAVGVDGIQFASRHGDELDLWCLYGQSHDSWISSHLLRLGELDLIGTAPTFPDSQG